MKLTYWTCECLNDSDAYNIRARTRKEAKAARDAQGEYASEYGQPKKVTVEYDNAFDLMNQCMGEGRGWWEA